MLVDECIKDLLDFFKITTIILILMELVRWHQKIIAIITA